MKFKDVTALNTEKIKLIQSTFPPFSQIKTFRNKETFVIYSFTNREKHASLSNHTRAIKEKEIRYIISNIMESTIEDAKFFVTPKGIIHIHIEEKQPNNC